MSRPSDLEVLIEEVLCHPGFFLGGVQDASLEPTAFLQAVVLWGQNSKRHLREFIAILEPCVRQSVVMTLLPSVIFDDTYRGTYDDAIDAHLAQLGLTLTPAQRKVVRDVCINIKAVRHLDGKAYRRQVYGLSDIKGRPALFNQLLNRQNGRCVWCGVDFGHAGVVMTLEHLTPKHIGGDHHSGTNWALACKSCNEGKKDVFAWPASATAHDYLVRGDFLFPNAIGLPQRWAVLMRCRKCEFCEGEPNTTELNVYRRISTGLPIPANCSLACTPCLNAEGLSALAVRWVPEEASRA